MKKLTIVFLLCSTLLFSACSSDKKAETADSTSKQQIEAKKIEDSKKKKAAEDKKLAEEAEKKKQEEIAKKLLEADAAMKTAESNPTDETITAAKTAVKAVPGGNAELNQRLEVVSDKLELIKQQASTTQSQANQQQIPAVQNDADGNGVPSDSPYNNTTPEERARGAQMEADAQSRYWEAYNNGAPPDDALAYADGRSNNYNQQPNDAAAQLDQYRSDFKAQSGREPTSGEIQSQWLQEQGIQ